MLHAACELCLLMSATNSREDVAGLHGTCGDIEGDETIASAEHALTPGNPPKLTSAKSQYRKGGGTRPSNFEKKHWG